MVKETNAKGVTVNSRAVALDPPAKSDVPIYQEEGWGTYEDSTAAKAAALAAVGTVVGLAMLEICLLAGPAFAVGARRSRRQLGLVGANGGDRRHIRAIVLAGGLVIGVAAAVVGTVLGLLLTFALQPVLEDYMGQRFGSFDVRPLELLGIGLLAVLTGLMAAIVPADHLLPAVRAGLAHRPSRRTQEQPGAAGDRPDRGRPGRGDRALRLGDDRPVHHRRGRQRHRRAGRRRADPRPGGPVRPDRTHPAALAAPRAA